MSTLSAQPERRCRPSGDPPDLRTRLRVAIVGAHKPIRARVRDVLDASDIATVVAEANGTRRSVTAACRQQPQVVLLEQHLGPRRRVTDLIRDILRSCPSAMTVIFSGLDTDTEEMPALRVRAFAFYEKDIVTAALPTTLAHDYDLFNRALAGKAVCSPAAAARHPCEPKVPHPG